MRAVAHGRRSEAALPSMEALRLLMVSPGFAATSSAKEPSLPFTLQPSDQTHRVFFLMVTAPFPPCPLNWPSNQPKSSNPHPSAANWRFFVV